MNRLLSLLAVLIIMATVLAMVLTGNGRHLVAEVRDED